VDQAATQPSSGNLDDGKKTLASNHPTPANEQVKKSEKAVKKNEKERERSANAEDVPVPNAPLTEQHPNSKAPGMPEIEIDVPDTPGPGKHSVRRYGGTTIRNLPDGTQVMTLPDGTKVVTFRDGTKQVFSPGQRIPRRRLP
jgi:hypothetical protein